MSSGASPGAICRECRSTGSATLLAFVSAIGEPDPVRPDRDLLRTRGGTVLADARDRRGHGRLRRPAARRRRSRAAPSRRTAVPAAATCSAALSGPTPPPSTATQRLAEPGDTVTRDDLRANFLRRVVDGSGERADLDEVCAAQPRELRDHIRGNADACGSWPSSAAPTRWAKIGTPSSASRSARRESRPCANAFTITAPAPSSTTRAARSEQRVDRAGHVRRVANAVRQYAHATAETRSSSGHQGGSPRSSSSLIRICTARGELLAVAATCCRRQAERGLHDRADQHLLRRVERRPR